MRYSMYINWQKSRQYSNGGKLKRISLLRSLTFHFLSSPGNSISSRLPWYFSVEKKINAVTFANQLIDISFVRIFNTACDRGAHNELGEMSKVSEILNMPTKDAHRVKTNIFHFRSCVVHCGTAPPNGDFAVKFLPFVLTMSLHLLLLFFSSFFFY